MQHSIRTIDAPDQSLILYNVIQQEVELGAQALKREKADVAVTFFQSALHKLTADQPFYDHLVHNLLSSYKLLIEQLLKTGDGATAIRFLHSALNLNIGSGMAEDSEFRWRFAGTFQELGLVFFKNRQFDPSISCFRKSLSIHQAPGFHINLSNALACAGRRAELADFATDITPDKLGRHVFIACVPKCASTFLKDLLVSLTGYRDVFMVQAAGQNEHELYLPSVIEAACLDTVTQQHCRASDANVQIMEAFGIKPVVLVRDIFDSVMSLLDFYDKGAFHNSYFRSDYQSLDEETRIDLLIDNVIPWYFQFVASWSEVERKRALDIFWLNYEELIADKPAIVQNVLKFYGLGASLRGIEQKIRETESQAGKIRFNKGVTGRGKSGLSDKQKEKVRGLARYYPTTDFGRIGL